MKNTENKEKSKQVKHDRREHGGVEYEYYKKTCKKH